MLPSTSFLFSNLSSYEFFTLQCKSSFGYTVENPALRMRLPTEIGDLPVLKRLELCESLMFDLVSPRTSFWIKLYSLLLSLFCRVAIPTSPNSLQRCVFRSSAQFQTTSMAKSQRRWDPFLPLHAWSWVSFYFSATPLRIIDQTFIFVFRVCLSVIIWRSTIVVLFPYLKKKTDPLLPKFTIQRMNKILQKMIIHWVRISQLNSDYLPTFGSWI